jgi:hypothetical protein
MLAPLQFSNTIRAPLPRTRLRASLHLRFTILLFPSSPRPFLLSRPYLREFFFLPALPDCFFSLSLLFPSFFLGDAPPDFFFLCCFGSAPLFCCGGVVKFVAREAFMPPRVLVDEAGSRAAALAYHNGELSSTGVKLSRAAARGTLNPVIVGLCRGSHSEIVEAAECLSRSPLVDILVL